MGETAIQQLIQLAASKDGHRLFRVNSGMAWAGRIVERTAFKITLSPYHPVQLAIEGTPDLCGWLGDGTARFCGVEVKDKTRASDAQRRFIAAIIAAGGRAGSAHNVEEARAIWTP